MSRTLGTHTLMKKGQMSFYAVMNGQRCSGSCSQAVLEVTSLKRVILANWRLNLYSQTANRMMKIYSVVSRRLQTLLQRWKEFLVCYASCFHIQDMREGVSMQERCVKSLEKQSNFAQQTVSLFAVQLY